MTNHRNYPDHRRYGTSLPEPCGTCSSTTRGRSNDCSGRRSSLYTSVLMRRSLSAVKAAVLPIRHQRLERLAWSQRHWASSACVWIVPKNGSEQCLSPRGQATGSTQTTAPPRFFPLRARQVLPCFRQATNLTRYDDSLSSASR